MKAILFDVYGTLISTGNGSVNAAAEILKKNNSQKDSKKFYADWKIIHKRNMQNSIFKTEREIFYNDLSELYSKYNIAGDVKTDVQIMLSSLYDRHAFAETAEVISKLKKRYRLIIASNTDTQPLFQNLKFNGLAFDEIFTSQMLGCYKPNSMFYLSVLERCGLAPDDTVFVGDSLQEDVIAPTKLGIKSVFVDRKNIGGNYGQVFTVTDLCGLLNII